MAGSEQQVAALSHHLCGASAAPRARRASILAERVAQPPAAPTQGQFAPLAPAGGFNVNQAAAGTATSDRERKRRWASKRLLQWQLVTPQPWQVQGQQQAYGYTPAQQRLQGMQTVITIQRSAVALHWLVVTFRNTKAPIAGSH